MGIRDYQQSMGVWVRGILQTEFGVKPEDMLWYQERGKHFSHTGATADSGLSLPPNIKLQYMQTDINTMLQKGELDAYFTVYMEFGKVGTTGIDRTRESHASNPDIVTLFSDPRQEAIRFYKKTGVFPPHHTTAVRESILNEHPWVAISLMEAFEESKRIATARLYESQPSLLAFGDHYLKETNDIFGPDPYAYGIKANAKAFDMVQTFSAQQGLTPRKQSLEEIFPLEVIYREERL